MGSSQQAAVSFSSGGSPPAESDALVASAGTGAANGTYTYTGTHNGKRYYNLSGTNAEVSAISWDTTKWIIYAAGGNQYYASESDTTYPWDAIDWYSIEGDAPVPTVTEV